jgi:hypothetical protein
MSVGKSGHLYIGSKYLLISAYFYLGLKIRKYKLDISSPSGARGKEKAKNK